MLYAIYYILYIKYYVIYIYYITLYLTSHILYTIHYVLYITYYFCQIYPNSKDPQHGIDDTHRKHVQFAADLVVGG